MTFLDYYLVLVRKKKVALEVNWRIPSVSLCYYYVQCFEKVGISIWSPSNDNSNL